MSTYAVTLYARVSDEKAVLDAAAAHLVETNSEPTLEAAVGSLDGDVGNALRLLLDPGLPPCPGFEILDSSAERG